MNVCAGTVKKLTLQISWETFTEVTIILCNTVADRVAIAIAEKRRHQPR
jgi:hypothetical protein